MKLNKCPYCREYSMKLLSSYIKSEETTLGQLPDYFVSRSYYCSVCRTDISLYTNEGRIFDIESILERDSKWLENLNTKKT